MTNNCEIVSNVACGKEFQYCRVHKVEPHQCPGNAKPAGPQPQAGSLHEYQVAINRVAAAVVAKRTFKVGDRVKHSANSPYAGTYARYGFPAGACGIITAEAPAYGSPTSLEVATSGGEWVFHMEPEWLEHV